MNLPRMDLLNLVNSLYTRLGKPGPKLSKDGDNKIVELRKNYFLSSIVNPLLKEHYVTRRYEVYIL